ncbi:MAG: RNA polymerase sigma factor [Candidatus Magasanikbacteria bacterium]|nr:RNA polymerase sigma factor [Candidatus Magasanikbacteria bacterium]
MPNGQLETMADEELVSLSIKKSEVFGVLMRRYQGRLLAYIRRLSGLRSEDAEDILQESYIKAYLNLNDFDRKLKFSSWLYRIVHNETISEWRKRKARPSVILENEDWEKIKSGDDMHNEMNARMDRARLEKAIDRLPEKYRDAIVLKYLEERTYEEMADILRKPASTIGTLISRAKKRLNKILKTYGA